MILHKTHIFTIWLDGSDLTFEYNKNGEQFTLYCDLAFDYILKDVITYVVVNDYDGCFDFDRDAVIEALEDYNSSIEIDFNEL